MPGRFAWRLYIDVSVLQVLLKEEALISLAS